MFQYAQTLGEVEDIMIGFLHVCFYTDHPILHKLFELCLFIQTVRPLENHMEDFFLAHTHSPEIINFDIWGYYNAPFISN